MKQKIKFFAILLFLSCICILPYTKSNAATPYKLSGKVWTQKSLSKKGTFKNGAILLQAKNKKEIRKILLQFQNRTKYKGTISYKIKTSDKKWSSYAKPNTTLGKNKYYIETIQIKLTGNLAKKYNIYYRTRLKGEGWLGWASNGKSAGSGGAGNQITGIQIVLTKKTDKKPSKTLNGIKSIDSYPLYRYPTTEQATTQHQHDWQPITESVQHRFCRTCNMDLTAAGIDPDVHSENSGTYPVDVGGTIMYFPNCAGSYSSYINVVTGYRCSTCGATK